MATFGPCPSRLFDTDYLLLLQQLRELERSVGFSKVGRQKRKVKDIDGDVLEDYATKKLQEELATEPSVVKSRRKKKKTRH